MKTSKQNREKVAEVLTDLGYGIMFLVIAIFIGWAVYRLYGYLGDGGFEWKKLLPLFSKKGIIKILTAYLDSFMWTGPVLGIGWAMGLSGDILERMVPGQNASDLKSLHIGLGVVSFSGLMSMVMLIPALSIYFFIPILLCAIGRGIAKIDDDDDDKKDQELEKTSSEVEQLKQRIEQLEKKLADDAKPDNETQEQ